MTADLITSIIAGPGVQDVYVGTSSGVYQSIDGGATWHAMNNGLGNATIASMSIDPSNQIWVGSFEGQVFHTAGPSAVTGLAERGGAHLEANYPNPCAGITSIGYSLSRESHVTLSVYDLNGTEIARLVDGRVEAGVHAASWDASQIPAGVYYCRMIAGDIIESHPMLVAH
jgi:hypothetical protein